MSAPLLPFLLPGLAVEHVSTTDPTLLIDARTSTPTASCPDCHTPSARVHSRYTRHLRDRPVSEQPVCLRLHGRAESHQKVINDVLNPGGAGESRLATVGQDFFEEVTVILLLRCGVNQTGIRRRILRLELADAFEVSRVGDDRAEFLDLCELVYFLVSLSKGDAHRRQHRLYSVRRRIIEIYRFDRITVLVSEMGRA